MVVHVNQDKANNWHTDEVLKRSHTLHKGTLITQMYLRGDSLSPGENMTFKETVEVYRTRLYDISWFMRNLNEYIARKAHKEEGLST